MPTTFSSPRVQSASLCRETGRAREMVRDFKNRKFKNWLRAKDFFLSPLKAAAYVYMFGSSHTLQGKTEKERKK